MAKPEKPVRRMVVVRIINPSMDTAEVVARFERMRGSTMLRLRKTNRHLSKACRVEALEPRLLLTAGPFLSGVTASTQSAPSDNQKFINEAYHDLLSRAPDAGGLDYWEAQLSAGAPQDAIANALTHSAEYYSTIIKPAYLSYLGRP